MGFNFINALKICKYLISMIVYMIYLDKYSIIFPLISFCLFSKYKKIKKIFL